jgi:hypothetical protein
MNQIQVLLHAPDNLQFSGRYLYTTVTLGASIGSASPTLQVMNYKKKNLLSYTQVNMVPFPKLTIYKTMIQHTRAASQSTDHSSVAEILTSLQPSEKNRYVC